MDVKILGGLSNVEFNNQLYVSNEKLLFIAICFPKMRTFNVVYLELEEVSSTSF